MRDMFVKGRRILAGSAKAEALLTRYLHRKCDWDIPADVAAYVKDRRQVAREKLLPDGRRCPICDEMKVESVRWVYGPDGFVCCKSCFQRACMKRNVDMTVTEKIFTLDARWKLDGVLVKKLRTAVGMGLVETAEKLGVSKPTLMKAEEGKTVVYVTKERAEGLVVLLRGFGVKTGDEMGGK